MSATATKKIPIKHILCDENVYFADDIKKFDSVYFYGCAKTIRKIVDKKKIPDDMYFYVSKTKDGWKKSVEMFKKSKLVIKTEWVEKNVPNMTTDHTIKNDIENAPDILELTEEESFKYTDGNVMNIEVRGERQYDKCYFSVRDVAKCFDVKSLRKVLTEKRTDGYMKNVHYKKFLINSKTILFLTYSGFIRMLYTSRKKNINMFSEPLTQLLFASHLGTIEQRTQSAATVMGCDVDTVKTVFGTMDMSVSCVYLFIIGTAKNLRTSMTVDKKYSDDMIIAKFGMTKSLKRRISEHVKTYQKINNSKLTLKYCTWIDDSFISTAETDLKKYFVSLNCMFQYEKMDELVILKPTQLSNLKKMYSDLNDKYGGNVKSITDKYSSEIIKLQHDLELSKETSEKKFVLQELECEKKCRLLEKENRCLENKIHELEMLLVKK
jgi:hypothetical protein